MIQKIVARCLFPLPLSTGLILLGLILLGFARGRKAGRRLIVAGTVLLLVFSSVFTSRVLQRPLERRHACCLDPVAALEARRQDTAFRSATVWIMVLGTGYHPDPRLPATSRVSSGFLARFLEGVRLHRAVPRSRLLVSIPGTAASKQEKRRYLDELAQLAGLPPKALELLELSRNTKEEAAAAAPVVGSQPFFLVTEAVHMPRAMLIFESAGLAPIAAPVGYTSGKHPFTDLNAVSLFPSAGGLGGTERAVYEYLGLFRELLRRRP